MRLFAFIVALLLLAGSIDPTRGWLIALVVATGLSAIRPRFWNWFNVRPAIDLRMAAFVLAVLLLAGTVDPTRAWLIALSVVTGLAMVMPRAFGLGWSGGYRDDGGWGWQRHMGRWSARRDHDWTRSERRMERRRMRHTDGWGDDWS
jgi:outer membrane murein-binding lipoprotein Lpp